MRFLITLSTLTVLFTAANASYGYRQDPLSDLEFDQYGQQQAPTVGVTDPYGEEKVLLSAEEQEVENLMDLIRAENNEDFSISSGTTDKLEFTKHTNFKQNPLNNHKPVLLQAPNREKANALFLIDYEKYNTAKKHAGSKYDAVQEKMNTQQRMEQRQLTDSQTLADGYGYNAEMITLLQNSGYNQVNAILMDSESVYGSNAAVPRGKWGPAASRDYTVFEHLRRLARNVINLQLLAGPTTSTVKLFFTEGFTEGTDSLAQQCERILEGTIITLKDRIIVEKFLKGRAPRLRPQTISTIRGFDQVVAGLTFGSKQNRLASAIFSSFATLDYKLDQKSLTWIGIGGTMTDMNLMDAEEQRLLFNFFYLMQGADEKFEVEFGIGTTNSIKQKYPKHDGLFSQNDVFLQCEIPEDTDTGRMVHAFVGMLDQKLKRIDSSVSYEIARYGIKKIYSDAPYPYTVDFARPLLMYKLDMINEKAKFQIGINKQKQSVRDCFPALVPSLTESFWQTNPFQKVAWTQVSKYKADNSNAWKYLLNPVHLCRQLPLLQIEVPHDLEFEYAKDDTSSMRTSGFRRRAGSSFAGSVRSAEITFPAEASSSQLPTRSRAPGIEIDHELADIDRQIAEARANQEMRRAQKAAEKARKADEKAAKKAEKAERAHAEEEEKAARERADKELKAKKQELLDMLKESDDSDSDSDSDED